MKKTIEGLVTYDNHANGGFCEWWYIEGHSYSNEWLKEFENKKVRITVEEVLEEPEEH